MLFQKIMVLGIIFIFFSLTVMSAIKASPQTEYPLPPPGNVDMILEESMFRRMSVRNYTVEPVTDQDLSTILWAAYGLRADGNRTVPGMNNVYAGIIYVLKEDAVYTYNPQNHSLVFYKQGDYRDVVGWQYKAPIQLGLVWNMSINSDQNYGAAELGEIGQNIQFMARSESWNCRNRGTTITTGKPQPSLEPHWVDHHAAGSSSKTLQLCESPLAVLISSSHSKIRDDTKRCNRETK